MGRFTILIESDSDDSVSISLDNNLKIDGNEEITTDQYFEMLKKDMERWNKFVNG
jgi:hypothetical protein